MSSLVQSATFEAMADNANNPAFVFVHGAWHNGSTWTEVAAELSSRGYASIANDLPGAGTNARNPVALSDRSQGAEALSTEVSPNVASQQDRTDAVIADVRAAAAMGNGRVVLVGHSLGGRTLSPVAESIPDEVGAVVYLTAQMFPESHPPKLAANRLLGSIMIGSFAQTKAFRVDVNSTDPDVLTSMREAFYNDLTDAQFAKAAARNNHSDEPLEVFTTPAAKLTVERFGSVERHYIRCLQDRALRPADQDAMIAATDEAFIRPTIVHDMDVSHSPFYSDPSGLTNILVEIAG